jgi:hypothetical protein
MGYKPGDWWVLCDVCSRKRYASQVKKRWDGLMVCEEDWETRHPQEFVRPINDQRPLPFVRPDNEGIEATLAVDCSAHYFVDVPYLIESSREIYKGYTLPPAVGVTISDGATVTVYCTWIIDGPAQNFLVTEGDDYLVTELGEFLVHG